MEQLAPVLRFPQLGAPELIAGTHRLRPSPLVLQAVAVAVERQSRAGSGSGAAQGPSPGAALWAAGGSHLALRLERPLATQLEARMAAAESA